MFLPLAPRRGQWAATILWMCLVLPIVAQAIEPRSWSSADGRFNVTAELIKVRGDTVKLKRSDGKVFDVKLSILSQEDRNYVQRLQQQSRSQPGPATAKPKILTLPGLLSIGTPADGFSWNSGGQRFFDGVQAYRLGCTKKGSSGSVTLQVELRASDTDQKRATAVQSDYQDIRARFAKAKLTKVKSPNLKISPPIPDSVSYHVSALQPDGSPFEFRVIHVFKENTYKFHIFATSVTEVDKLAEVVATLTELGTSPIAKADRKAGGRFKHVTYGFSFQPPEGFEVIDSDQKGVIVMFREPNGANMNFRAMRRTPEFDLEAAFQKVQEAPTAELEDFESIGSGDIPVFGEDGKWRTFAFDVEGTRLKVVQYYFASEEWVFIVTCSTRATDFDSFRPVMDTAIRDLRFES